MSNSSFLSFRLPDDSEELRQITDSVRKLVNDTLFLRPGEVPRFSRTDFERFAALGLTAMTVPEEHGGSPVPPLTIAAVLFEIARAQLGPAIYLSVHLMVSKLLANSQADPTLLRDLAEGRKLAAFCLTEARAGSDAASLETRAEPQGEEWLLNGEKIYITSAGVADVYFVFARTGGPGRGGISAFVVERGATGLGFGADESKMGCEGSTLASVFFRNTPARLVGEREKGYDRALEALAGGRVSIAACATALASRAIEVAALHLQQREQFGSRLSAFQGLQFLVSDMLMKLRASILLTRDACAALERNPADAAAAAGMAKCFSSDSAMAITTDAVQLLGGAGYIRDFGVERLMRDAKMLQIVERTNQIQRIVVAKAFTRSLNASGTS